jgi:hypothetical protein
MEIEKWNSIIVSDFDSLYFIQRPIYLRDKFNLYVSQALNLLRPLTNDDEELDIATAFLFYILLVLPCMHVNKSVSLSSQ